MRARRRWAPVHWHGLSKRITSFPPRQTKKGCMQELMGCEAENEFKLYESKDSANGVEIGYSLEKSACFQRTCCKNARGFDQTIWAGSKDARGDTLMTMHKELSSAASLLEAPDAPTQERCVNRALDACGAVRQVRRLPVHVLLHPLDRVQGRGRRSHRLRRHSLFLVPAQGVGEGSVGRGGVRGPQLARALAPRPTPRSSAARLTRAACAPCLVLCSQLQQPSCCGGFCVNPMAEGLCNW